ncbi:MAG TPA: hypothetical protein VFP84_39945, partial [Kofleriaceae bacterium]|nr:hypothetical protein [Kofleriaceae bacterium]
LSAPIGQVASVVNDVTASVREPFETAPAPVDPPAPPTAASRPPAKRPVAAVPLRTQAAITTPSPATAPTAPTASAVAAPAVHRPGCKVRINLTPWAYYTTDVDLARHETPSTVELPPGPHRLRVWNPELHVEREIMINVPADRDTMNFSEPLQPSSLPASAPR